MSRFREYDVVRVVLLRRPERPYDGTQTVCRAPAVGDLGTIVHELDARGPPAKYVIECVDDDGMTLWLADFHDDEIELVERPE